MTNLFMKFQNCNLIFVTEARKDGRTNPKQYNMLLQLFQIGGIIALRKSGIDSSRSTDSYFTLEYRSAILMVKNQ